MLTLNRGLKSNIGLKPLLLGYEARLRLVWLQRRPKQWMASNYESMKEGQQALIARVTGNFGENRKSVPKNSRV